MTPKIFGKIIGGAFWDDDNGIEMLNDLLLLPPGPENSLCVRLLKGIVINSLKHCSVPITSRERANIIRLAYKVACQLELTIGAIAANGYIHDMDEKIIKEIFGNFQEYSLNPNSCDVDGMTLVHYACGKEDNLPILTELLSCEGTDLNKKTHQGNSPLHYAVQKNNILAVGKLLSLKNHNGIAQVNVNVADIFGSTPLHHALNAKNINFELIKLLLDHGADVNIQNFGGFSPVHTAVDAGYEALALLLNTKKCILEVNACDGSTPLKRAVAVNDGSCVKLLLEKGAMTNLPDERGLCLLHIAALGKPESLKTLLPYMRKEINSIDKKGFTPLHLAVQHDVRCVTQLLENGAIVDACNKAKETPLHYAASNGKSDCIKLLVQHGANINSNQTFYGRPIDGVDFDGFTPLHFAIYNKHLDAVKTLIHLGADVTLTTAQGKTVLDLANESGDEQIKALIAEVLAAQDPFYQLV